MNLRILEYLVTVAELGHFTKAAKKCYVSQPTLSTQLKKLEDQLGVIIFERDNKNVMLTRTGAKIVHQAKQVLLEAKELTVIAKNSSNPLSGKFKIGIIPTIGPYIIPTIIKEVKEQLSDIKLIVVEDDAANLTSQLKNGELDAVIVSSPISSMKGVHFEVISEEKLFVALHADHELASEGKLKQIDLIKETILTLDESHCLRELIVNIFSEDQISKDFKANNLTTLMHLVAQNQGITIIPKMAIEDCPPNVRVIPLDHVNASRQIKIGSRTLNARMDALKSISSLLEEICN
ncbi:MAG: DNA-binding transcriptional regulator OxyR [Legionellales bacterium]|nr:DNA-binding transcriptional regulator OxyR [Legionellales bacterium]